MQRTGRRAWTGGAAWQLCGTLLLAIAILPAHAAAVGGSVSASTDYVYRGFSQSRGEAVLQLDLHVDTPHWTLGAWASPVQLLPRKRSTELNVYSEWRWLLGSDFAARAGIVRYLFPNDPRSISYAYTELNAALNWRDRVTATVSWSPKVALYAPRYNAVYDHRSFNGELNVTQPLPRHWLMHAGVGRFIASGTPTVAYSYGSVGAQRAIGPVRADLSWFWSQNPAAGVYAAGLQPDHPWVATLLWGF